MTKHLKEIAKQMMVHIVCVTNTLSGEKLKKDSERNINLFSHTTFLMPLWNSPEKHHQIFYTIYTH